MYVCMYVCTYVRTYVHIYHRYSCMLFLHWTELTGELSHGVPASVEDLISFATFLFAAEKEYIWYSKGNDQQWTTEGQNKQQRNKSCTLVLTANGVSSSKAFCYINLAKAQSD